MKLNSAQELKEKFKKEFVEDHLAGSAAAKVEALTGANRIEASSAVLPVDQRLSVGLSKKDTRAEDYQIELRIQREGGRAHRAAEKFKKEASDEANIEIVPRIEAPSVSLVEEETKGSRTGVEPLRIGVSVSHRDGPTGTLGAFISTKKGDGILSNAHVFSPGTTETETNEYIFHPGSADARRLIQSMRVAKFCEATEFFKKKANDTDAATALLLEKWRDHDGNVIPKGCGHEKEGRRLGRVITMGQLRPQQSVSKIGRTTDARSGKISAIALDNVPIEVPGLGVLSFSNVIEIRSVLANRPFTMPGDSGSVVFTDDDLAPFGLHFAGTYKSSDDVKFKISYACDLETALTAVGAEWLR